MTVYERFVELASDLIEQCGVEQRKAVLEGIRAHLDRSGVGQMTEDVDRLAKREWIRFRGISKASFCAFFENYEIRRNIETCVNECALAATDRLKNNILLKDADYTKMLSSFYSLASLLVGDIRYTGWLEEQTDKVTKDLQFASGKSDSVRRDVISRVQFSM